MAAEAPVLVLISCDPRESHRAFEAMRIGTGIVAGENKVVFVLQGPAVHLLDDETDELVDGDDIAKFRTTLKTLGVPFHIEAGGAPTEPDWNADGYPVVELTRDAIVALAAHARRALVF